MSKGFPCNIIYKMLEDNQGICSCTTNNGLICLIQLQIIWTYTTSNGLLATWFNYQSGYKDEKGYLYFGSINGFITFNPTTFAENKNNFSSLLLQISFCLISDSYQPKP